MMENNVVFLMIARLLYDKGYNEYVEAAKIIRREYPNTEFQLLGRIDEGNPSFVPKDVLEKDVMEGTVNYLGFISNVKTIIKEADCVVHPTFYNEGLSRVLMEALAMRKPVITTSIPGCKETVEDGYNGYLVQPRNVPSLVDAIRRFLSLSMKEREQMGRNGRIKAEKQFDVKKVIAVYKQITDTVLGKQ